MTRSLIATPLGPHVTRIALPTPTLPPLDSTNTYIIHAGSQAIVVDCGNAETAVIDHLAGRLREQGIATVKAYIATHYHLDHTQGIPRLQQYFPAPVYVHSLDQAGAAKEMNGSVKDLETPPETFAFEDVRVLVQHQPGHTHGHLHLFVEPDKLLLVGDHMAGTGTVWIGPPDGHMQDYYRALRQIAASSATLALPGHGAPIAQPQIASQTLLDHRLQREAQILEFLAQNSHTLDEIVQCLYGNRQLGGALRVAKRTTQGHIAHLLEQGQIKQFAKAPDFRMRYTLADTD